MDSGELARRGSPRFAALIDALAGQGLDLTPYAPDYVERRLNGRLSALGMRERDWEGYQRRLRSNPEELARLAQSLSINVTEFFRDESLWERLREDIFPRALRAKGDALRIWSCGCATGEEPYTIAISLLEAVRRVVGSIRTRSTLIATDLSGAAVGRAKAGVYPEAAVAKVPAALRERYFVPAESSPGQVSVRPILRESVEFRVHDALLHAAPQRLDFIFCRNMTIYLGRPAKEALLKRFHAALAPAGLLILGKCEMVPPALPYRTLDVAEHIYARLDPSAAGE